MYKAILALLLLAGPLAHAQQPYRYTADLAGATDDKVTVTLEVPKDLGQDELEFVMPKVVPGTYEDYYFGRYLEDFQAFDKKGKPLTTKSIERGTWRISDAKKLAKITYKVNDSFDDANTGEDEFVFQPAGTNIDAGKNYVVNGFGFFGYFEGYSNRTFEVNLKAPAGFKAGAAWDYNTTGNDFTFSFPSYFLLSDNPIMVAPLDTMSFYAGGARIGISLYSETGAVTLRMVEPTTRKLAAALLNFFDGKLPAARYDFLFYCYGEGSNLGQGYGALEHLQSSMYYLPEMEGEALTSTLGHMCAHEFMHILTPLNLQAEQIGNFDFRKPEMSAHLWLYEGCTEYFSNLVQLQGGLLTPDEFMAEMRGKIQTAERFGNYSFTENSKNILEEEAHQRYQNVYEKGALIGWMLDLKLRQLSQGQLDLKGLLLKLKDVYGPTRPFKDDELFAEIAKYSGFPELKGWLEKYVAGTDPLPFEELLLTLGYVYQPEGEASVVSFCQSQFSYNPQTLEIFVAAVVPGNCPLGMEQGDVVLKVQGEPLTLQNAQQLLTQHLLDPKEGQELTLTIRRGDTEMELKGTATAQVRTVKHALSPLDSPTDTQTAAWQNFTTGK